MLEDSLHQLLSYLVFVVEENVIDLSYEPHLVACIDGDALIQLLIEIDLHAT